MAQPTSRETLLEYCLRRLGAPVIDINVDPDQLEDKIDDALQYYQEYHSDATLKTYLTHTITQADLDNDYITIPASVLFISKVFSNINDYGSRGNMFDMRYQMHLNDMSYMSSWVGDLANYAQFRQYLETLDMVMTGQPRVQFARRMNRLYIFGDLGDSTDDYKVGDVVCYEAYQVIDPVSYSAIWKDMFVKDYTTALIKQQWGANMMKFEGVALPGGITFNGHQYYDDATNEINDLKERLRLEQELPIDFMIG